MDWNKQLTAETDGYKRHLEVQQKELNEMLKQRQMLCEYICLLPERTTVVPGQTRWSQSNGTDISCENA
jgi:hypothetical protein